MLWLGLRACKARAMCVSVYYERCGVWVPACAGTTEEGLGLQKRGLDDGGKVGRR